MSDSSDRDLRDIKKALAKFPRIVRKERENHAANLRVLRRFRPFARDFAKFQDAEREMINVRAHRRKVARSSEHPDGVTIVRRHLRRAFGTNFKKADIFSVFQRFDRANLRRPIGGKIKAKDADLYDEQISVWVAYFENLYGRTSAITPNVIKALIASESDFNPNPNTKIAIGIAQITRSTFKILKDVKGEAKDFIFTDVALADLKNPEIAIPMAVRWVFRKLETARGRLRREPSSEELILEYKGLLNSKSKFRINAIEKFRRSLESLESASNI